MPFESFVDLVSTSPWTYAVILAVAAIDAIFPLVPSEATVISAGVLAGAGGLELGLVIVAGAAGAYTGDNGGYWLGRGLGGRADASIFRSPKAKARKAWAERTLDRHGGPLIVGARFVPGGRTATMLTAGLVRMRWLRFATFAGVAAAVWASYAALVGYVGGRTFEDNPLAALGLGFGVAFGLYALIEGLRALRRRRRGDASLDAA